MDFKLTEEQFILINTIRKLGKREKFRELAAEIDRTKEFPHQLIPKYQELGLLGMPLPTKYGGGGQSMLTTVMAIEELAKFSPMIAAPVFESSVGAVRIIEFFGTEEQKQEVLPGVCSGEFSVSAAMTEPAAGSDLTALSTKLTEQGDHYVLNGSKTFITGGGEASHYLVYCRINGIPGFKGIGGVLLRKGTPGFTFGKQEEFMGLHGMPSCELFFEDVKIPRADLVIDAGGFKNLMNTFEFERCGNAAMCLGVAGGAIEEAKNFAVERKAFGRPICEFQDIQFSVVEMTMKLEAAKLLVYRAAAGSGKGLPSVYEASLGKCYANQMVVEVTGAAMQVLGGYGYSTAFPVERMARDARAWGVAGGTIQMLKVTMASMIFGRRFDQRA